MAISPIQIFGNDQKSSVAQIIEGGTMTIQHILDNAIQIGRDMSNKQLAQERDMLAMRQQETGLAQRRAENLQQDLEDSIRFSRSAFEADRRFAADEAYRQDRAAASDAQSSISNQFQQERLDLSREAGQRAERQLDLTEEGMRLKQEQAAADQQFWQDFSLDSGPPSAAPSDAPARPSDIFRTKGGTPSPPEPSSDIESLYAEREKFRALEAEAPNAGVRANIAAQRGRVDARIRALEKTPGAPDGPSETELRMRRKEERDITSAEAKQAEKDARILVADPVAFTSPSVWMKRDSKGVIEGTPQQIAEMEAYDKDRYSAEYNYALNNSEDSYVQKGGTLTPAQKEKRRRFWRYVHGESSGTSGGAVERIPGLSEG